MRLISLVFLLYFFILMFNGCATPEGGSSIPWSQPAAWEGKGTPSGNW
ncbi:MAG: hypothetical protein KAQ99_04685 [Candidatus Aureabacteria bacterium]|nr:hypothetical protein [Candidatus Auribacterota bacterium]